MTRLARDQTGNTLMIVAAAIFPLMALVGGGVDLGRIYLSQARLQQACDAGALAARKQLGSDVAADGTLPADADTIGNRFFDLNFADRAYGTRDRTFALELEDDYSVNGTATVTVPTTIMKIFDAADVPLTVNCAAKLNFSNVDVMMVLDTTGSMAETNAGDSVPKIDALRGVVKSFHHQLETAKAPGTRIRYGFVPYSTNVNVGWLLKSGWLVNDWQYQGRVARDTGTSETIDQYDTTYTIVSGTQTSIVPFEADVCPGSTAGWTTIEQTYNPDGSGHGTVHVDGIAYSCTMIPDSNRMTVTGTHYNNYTYSWNRTFIGTTSQPVFDWTYRPVTVDVRPLKGGTDDDGMAGGSVTLPMGGYPSSPSPLTGWFRGCVEERATYDIDNYGSVDLTRALDLDIDLVPNPADPDTQWRPMINEFSFVRSINWSGIGTFSPAPVNFRYDFLIAGWSNLSVCPTSARKLAEMTEGEVASYVDGLSVGGSTYHDIGMIWGGRLISPTGLFAAENANVDGKSTNRHLIFLTDGETAPLDLSYGTYGIEPLDQRRWSPSSSHTLRQTVENRFAYACQQVRNRNITVWVVGFGTEMTDLMKQCSGPGRWFQADDATQLNDVFTKIAKAMGELRVTK
ncbi:MAG: pilus assembly protein TadG-related protein [Novosphingobium sp.]|nr:pilus assembly protein TadG-related protein [Novosphingobium sp.]